MSDMNDNESTLSINNRLKSKFGTPKYSQERMSLASLLSREMLNSVDGEYEGKLRYDSSLKPRRPTMEF